jgi:DNA-binding IclR family transcriptional regulator
MPKTVNVLQVLRLFNDERRQLQVAQIARLLAVSPATAYRYVAELEQAGLVEAAALGWYVLGPGIVELDRQIREHDPLIAAATDIMRGLSERTGGTALLARLHGLKVMCVHQVRGRHGPVAVSYERGRTMPLYRGATSKAILAHLGGDEIRRLVHNDAPALRRAGLPIREEALHERLASLREREVVHTSAEVDPDALGWAAAIRHGRQVLGSVSLVMSSSAPGLDPHRLAAQLLRAAMRVQARIESANEQPAVGSRAVSRSGRAIAHR